MAKQVKEWRTEWKDRLKGWKGRSANGDRLSKNKLLPRREYPKCIY